MFQYEQRVPVSISFLPMDGDCKAMWLLLLVVVVVSKVSCPLVGTYWRLGYNRLALGDATCVRVGP